MAVALAVLWGPLTIGGWPAASALGIQAMAIVALGFWIVRVWTQHRFRLLWPPVCWAVLVFILYALVRCQARCVIIEYSARMELIQVIAYASLFFVVVNNLHRREAPTVIALCLIGLGLVLSWMAVYQCATKSTQLWGVPRPGQYLGRGSGTYLNPNQLAGLLGLAIPLALSYTVLSRFKPVMKVLFIYGAIAMMAGVAVTLSRGGIISVSATLAVFCLVLLLQRGYWLPALAILAVIAGVGILFATQFESLQRRFLAPFEAGHEDIRTQDRPVAVHLFEDHPWWGGGPGHFDSEFARYRPPVVQIRPVYAHNDYLNTLSDWGGVGMTVIAVVIALVVFGVFKTWPSAPPEVDAPAALKSDRAAFLMGAALGLLDILFHSAFDFNMHAPANAAIVVILLALVSGYWRFTRERYRLDPRWFGKVGLTVVLLAAMAWLAGEGARRGREAFWQQRANDDHAAWNDRLAGLQNAYEAEPSNYVNSYNLGEYYRLVSQDGKPGYEGLAQQAMEWYAKSMTLNPLDAYVPMRYGMCLDWIGRTNEATPYFQKAEKMDPNNLHVAYFVGRHYVELGDYAEARRWFQHSIDIHWTDLAGSAMMLLDDRMRNPLYSK